MKKTVGIVVIILATGLTAWYLAMRGIQRDSEYAPPSAPTVADNVREQDITTTQKRPEPKGPITLKFRANEFSDKEKTDFAENFKTKYRPAILKWTAADHGHVPISPADVTIDKLAERVGNDIYSEYIFVVDGVTLGVRDSKAEVTVDYLNVRRETQKLNTLANGSEVPKVTSPVNQQDILKMVRDDIGAQVAAKDVRTISSGISSGLNGGAVVEVGGDPNNFASWRLNLVFSADGSLAYYLKNPPEE